METFRGRTGAFGTPGGTVIVTGGGRGIGAATASLLARRGFAVAVNYAKDEASAKRLVTDIRAEGGRAMPIQADVATEADVLRLFETAEERLGPIVGVVNNAGVTGGFARVEDLGADTLQRVLSVNITGAFLCAREAVRRLSTVRGGEGGAIVNVSSRAAVLGGSGEWVHYAASKGALDSLTIGLAREVADEGIRVNGVAAGLIETDLHAEAGAPERVHVLAQDIPMRRPGRPSRSLRPSSGFWLPPERLTLPAPSSRCLADVEGVGTMAGGAKRDHTVEQAARAASRKKDSKVNCRR